MPEARVGGKGLIHSLTDVDLFVAFLKDNCRLASPPFMLTVLAAGVALLFSRRLVRVGKWWLTLAVVAFWIASTPVGAWLMSEPLARGTPRIESREQAQGAQAVVVLGGGIVSYVADGFALDDLNGSAPRVIEGARVYRVLGDPPVIVSGGNTVRLDPPRSEASAFRDAIVKLGVPPGRIILEDQGMTTREEALRIKPMLAARHISRVVLVTSPTHMGRSLAAFRAVGIDVVPSVSRLRTDKTVPWSLWPDRESLIVSDSAVYDYAGWLYYRLRGWT
jgi:uncharacterized SAM-binding protein YcdF (DUF218 family)